MTHDHAHDHSHSHSHGHAHPHHPAPAVAEREVVAPTVLMSSAATRIAVVLGALAALWAAVAWALTDLAA
ncbi:MAG: hypothetical protein AB7U92_08335 [Piscinibacter sp.]|uniref:hypothetical protein n=1 Tax=Piscinibacter sp. TaxID=1903157 RepID=UPI003D1416FD